jgi:hypothetical protein
MIKVEVKTKKIDEMVKNFPIRVRKEIADGLDHSSRSFLNKLLKERLQGAPGIKARPRGIFHRFRRITLVNDKAVFLRTSAPQSETVTDIAKSSRDIFKMSVEIYTKSKVAGIFERGGIIHSKKPMPIPLNDTARDMIRMKLSLKNLSAVFINDKMFLARENGTKKPQLLFILKRSTKPISPRLGFYDTFRNHQPRHSEIMQEAFQRGLEKL